MRVGESKRGRVGVYERQLVYDFESVRINVSDDVCHYYCEYLLVFCV